MNRPFQYYINSCKIKKKWHPIRVHNISMFIFISAGEDYLAINTIITFLVEELEKSVLLTVLDNDVVEDAEQLTVTISPVAGNFPVVVANSVVTISITDNDGMTYLMIVNWYIFVLVVVLPIVVDLEKRLILQQKSSKMDFNLIFFLI